jgi:hypothetical protein
VVFPVVSPPTAVQFVGFGHDTPIRSISAFLSFADVVFVQAVPFQCSVNVLSAKAVEVSVRE